MKYDLLQLLANAGYLTETDVALLKEFMVTWQLDAFSAILRTHLLSEQSLTDILAKILYLEKMDAIMPRDVGADAFTKISYRDALKWEVMPLGLDSQGTFRFVLANPTREDVLHKLEECVEGKVTYLVAARKTVLRAIDKNYPVEDQMPHLSARECRDSKN